ncbi:hypothetical protein QOZ80_2BG0206160 [Eleusine coracana subsp. coracana]|nr:hypothetical protein QOZ80_2BG0206160 [Eleusine coracana subsp. coracana]
MSSRRFVNLVINNSMRNTYDLRRIDMSRFFPPAATKIGNRQQLGKPVKENGSLPDPTTSFYSTRHGPLEFILVKNKLVYISNNGGAMMYDPHLHAIRTLPRLTEPKASPISIANKSGVLFVLDGGSKGSFESLVYETPCDYRKCKEGKWEWRALPPPPFFPTHGTNIDSWALIDGSHIWVSTTTSLTSSSTYSFDTERLVWSDKSADWSLPFSGRAEYVPEHKLWFGISSTWSRSDQGGGHHDVVFCASDLAAAAVQTGSCPPGIRTVNTMIHDKDWDLVEAHAVHLGCGKFCVARFFSTSTTRFGKRNQLNSVVLSGVETAKGSSDDDDYGEVQIIEHRSERYMLGYHQNAHCAL